jgi:hypothetical protein
MEADMNNTNSWSKVFIFALVAMFFITAASLLWAWFSQDLSSVVISRGFFICGALALLFGLGNFSTSYGFVDQKAPSYSAAFYKTINQRVGLMFSDLAEHSRISLILLITGILSLIIGFLILRFA